EETEKLIDWGLVNQAIDEDVFDKLCEKVIAHLNEKNKLFIFQRFTVADSKYRLPVQVFNEHDCHKLPKRELLLTQTQEDHKTHQAEFTVVSAPSLKANPKVDGTNSEAFVLISFEKRMVLIGGTEYAGEIKKSIFSVMNYMLPQREILPMHCSANVGK